MASPTTSNSLIDSLKIFGPASLLMIIGFVVAYQFVDPAPPDTITIGTGTTEGAYYQFAQRYRDFLTGEGITLNIESTAGSVENLRRLEADPESAPDAVNVAFVQGGTEAAATSTDLLSLGSLYFEPLWLFHRADMSPKHLSDLHHKKIAVGPEGSGTRAVALQLLADNDFDTAAGTLLPLTGNPAAEALAAADIDAAFFVASPSSTVVRHLLQTPGVALMSFHRADAYTRIHRFLSKVVLPAGVIDFKKNIPAQDTALLAPTANLVVKPDFHPALIDLMLQAAAKVHGPGDLFERPGQFPAPEFLAFPLSPDAKRFFDYGPPFLQRYLPFWAATLVDRLKVMLVPLLALLLPLFRVMPPAYRWRVRSRIYRWYRELDDVDLAAKQDPTAGRLVELINELNRIEKDLVKVPIPLSYHDELYNLRLHINLVRRQLEDARQ